LCHIVRFQCLKMQILLDMTKPWLGKVGALFIQKRGCIVSTHPHVFEYGYIMQSLSSDGENILKATIVLNNPHFCNLLEIKP
ncbi:hypothetical protein NSB20_18640, partial [Bacteroides acidifaciens]|uniref:hypothetical protein n=1 Tax=Bacteroides acidifaciens TaxID=85831 RepID=UPI00214A2B85